MSRKRDKMGKETTYSASISCHGEMQFGLNKKSKTSITDQMKAQNFDLNCFRQITFIKKRSFDRLASII